MLQVYVLLFICRQDKIWGAGDSPVQKAFFMTLMSNLESNVFSAGSTAASFSFTVFKSFASCMSVVSLLYLDCYCKYL